MWPASAPVGRIRLHRVATGAINVIVNYANTSHADRTAAGLYASRLAEIQDLLARITGALEAHSARQQQKAGDYGYAGTLGSITEQLAYILATLGDRSGVEAKGLKF